MRASQEEGGPYPLILVQDSNRSNLGPKEGRLCLTITNPNPPLSLSFSQRFSLFLLCFRTLIQQPHGNQTRNKWNNIKLHNHQSNPKPQKIPVSISINQLPLYLNLEGKPCEPDKTKAIKHDRTNN